MMIDAPMGAALPELRVATGLDPKQDSAVDVFQQEVMAIMGQWREKRKTPAQRA